MLKFVACSRILKHVVTCRSVIPLCPPSSAVTSQFIKTNSYRLYSTDVEEPHKRYDLGTKPPSYSVFRSLRRLSNKIALPKNVQLVIDTKTFNLYSTDLDEPRKPGWFNQLSLIRSLKRLSKRIVLRRSSNVHVVRPMSKKEDDEALYVIIPLDRVRKLEDVNVSVDHGTVFIQGKIDLEKHLCWVNLPDIDLIDKMFKTSDIKAEYNPCHARLKLIIPKVKKEEVVYDVNIKTTYDRMSRSNYTFLQ